VEKRHHKLEVWQDAIELVEAVYRFSAQFPNEEKYGLTAQIRRAAVSVPSDIAQGVARPSRKDYVRFLGVARSSLSALETQIVIATRLGIAPKDEALLGRRLERVFARLNALMRSLSQAPESEE
jgi:four helix bundle protein